MFGRLGKIAIFFIAVLILATVFLSFDHEVNYSRGSRPETVSFEIRKGEGNAAIGERLEQEGLVKSKFYFYYFVRTHGLVSRLMPGTFELNGNMTVPEIAAAVTRERRQSVRVTFPEGWTVKQMAARLTENKLPGEDYLTLAVKPTAALRARFPFLDKLPASATLEGFLFPDTYDFYPETDAEGIINKQLQTFESKIYSRFAADIESSEHDLLELVTMASIIEGEVQTPEDRRIVSGLFWNRIANNHALQSCATIAYVLGEKKKQYSFEDTRTPSPYNTYLNPGLIPGPISNPGVDAFEAALKPTKTDYVYFLTDPKTGKTIFSRTIDEHNANKAKYGL